MFPLMRLPNELIRRVIEAVHPAGIEPLAACGNNLIGTLMQETLARHGDLKARNSNLTLGIDGERQLDLLARHHRRTKDPSVSYDCPRIPMARFLHDSHLAFYPIELQVIYPAFDEIEDEEWNSGFTDSRRGHSDISSDIIESINSSLYFQDQEKAELCKEVSSPYDRSAGTAFLLTVLPNIESLTLCEFPTHLHECYLVRPIVERIAEVNRSIDPRSYYSGTALSQLKEVTFNFCTFSTMTIRSYIAFATLPSMRALYGEKVTGGGKPPLWPTFLKGDLSVMEISFTKSAVNPEAFEFSLTRISRLQEFTYHHNYDGGVNYQPRDIIDLLRLHAHTSLVLLDLSAQQDDRDLSDHEVQNIGSLQMFTALKSVRLDDTLFKRPDWNPGDEEPLEGRAIYRAEDYEEDEYSMESLVDVLPKTVEDLTLIQYCGEIRELFRNLVGMKDERLPELKKITIEETNTRNEHRGVGWFDPLPDPIDDSMKDSLKDVGVECVTIRHPPPLDTNGEFY